MHIANVFTLGFSLGCAWSPTVGSLIAFRFLSKILFKWCSTFVTDDHQLASLAVRLLQSVEALWATFSQNEIGLRLWRFLA